MVKFNVVDLFGDFWFFFFEVYEVWYKKDYIYFKGFEDVVYGLFELYSVVIEKFLLVVNFGCYFMSVILGFVLLIDVGWVDLVYVIVDFKLGIIGVGIKVKLIMYYFNVSDNFKVYGLKFYCYIVEI